MSRSVAAMAALLVVLGLLVVRPAEAATVRIMPLGDSITGSPGCWRALLWNQLQSAGYTNIDFVGTLPPQGCGVAVRRRQRGPRRLPRHQRRRPEPAARLAVGDPPRHRADALRHQRRVEQHRRRPRSSPRTRTLVDQMRASNPSDEDPGRPDHPDEPEQLRRVRAAGGRPEQRDPGLGRRRRPRRRRRSRSSTSGPASARAPTPTTACTPTTPATRRWRTAGTRRWSALLGGAQPSPSPSPSHSPSPSPSPSPTRSPSPSPSPSSYPPSPPRLPRPRRLPRPPPAPPAAARPTRSPISGAAASRARSRSGTRAPRPSAEAGPSTWTFADGQRVTQGVGRQGHADRGERHRAERELERLSRRPREHHAGLPRLLERVQFRPRARLRGRLTSTGPRRLPRGGPAGRHAPQVADVPRCPCPPDARTGSVSGSR